MRFELCPSCRSKCFNIRSVVSSNSSRVSVQNGHTTCFVVILGFMFNKARCWSRGPNIAQNKIAKRSESEIFFAKNCEAKIIFVCAKRSEAKRSEAKRMIFENCEKVRTKSENCEIPNGQNFRDKLWILTIFWAFLLSKSYIQCKQIRNIDIRP